MWWTLKMEHHHPPPTNKAGTRHPLYRGVRKRRWGKWVSEIRQPRKKSRIWLGSFPVPEMAAKAYDVAAYCLKGRKAQLNFPDQLHLLPLLPSTCSPRDIQAAAAKAANSMKDAVTSTRTANDDQDDDFWGEIELPELMDGECGYWSSPSGSSWTTSSGDMTVWPEVEQQQPFTACL
ncbi:hypothetical protein PIB30_007679 [Stylosanthes scabra]|uniref:AP2/ERF domain-containing protein n=1 Tax=Stylosanthes scabra TaxID=79078 RepID=A0ABU6W7W0_9FABA|nr:hypothetical protein [Stylosanthes scabra]